MRFRLTHRLAALMPAISSGCTLILWPALAAANGTYTASQYQQMQHWREQASATAHRQALQACRLAAHPRQLPAGDAPSHHSALSRELLRMLQQDQSAREVYYALQTPASHQRFKQVDADNLPRLRRILASGFPTPATVGLDASEAALTLVIHADAAPELQRSTYRQILQLEAERKLPRNFALTMPLVRPAVLGPIAAQRRPEPSAATVARSAAAIQHGDACYASQYSTAYHQQLRRTAAAIRF